MSSGFQSGLADGRRPQEMGGGGRKERRGVRSLGLALAPAWRAPPSGTGRPRIPVTAPPFPPPGSGVAGALLLSPSPDASLSHPDFPERCVHLCKLSLRLHRRESPLCHLLPAGTLGDVAVIGVAFSLRSVSDFLCGPTESAILPEPQFLYLLNEPTGPPAFPISEGRCENSMS